MEDEAHIEGLKLNYTNIEPIHDDACAHDVVLSVTSGIKIAPCGQVTFLSTSIGSVYSPKLKKLTLNLMGERLQRLPCQNALLVLHHLLAIPKVLYVIHTPLCFFTEQLGVYDRVLRSIIFNDLSQKMAWMQASLCLHAEKCFSLSNVSEKKFRRQSHCSVLDIAIHLVRNYHTL